jgi:hypothetical protein
MYIYGHLILYRGYKGLQNGDALISHGFQNNPAAAGAPAGGTMFTAGYYLKHQFCSPSSTLSVQTNLFFLNLVYTL